MKLHEWTIFVDDVDGVADYYQRLLGAPPVHRQDGLAIFKAGEGSVLIHVRYPPQPQWLPPENHVCFAVADLDAEVARLAGQGVKIEIPPRDYPWGRSAYLRDPDGHLLELHEER